MKNNLLTPGRLFYLCYHRPKTWLQDRRDQVAGRHGDADMRASAASLPPASLATWGLTGPPCRFLTGSRFVHQTIFCARSFEWACGTHTHLEVFSDGTLDSLHISQIQCALPHAIIVSEAEAETRLDRVIPADRFPYLRSMRTGHPLMRKLLDLHAGYTGPALHLDSDMLFFNTPRELRTWLREPSEEFFMQQTGDALVGERNYLEEKLGQPILPGINTGIVAVDGAGFDWPGLEHAAALLTEEQRAHKWSEQSLFAMHLSRRHAKPLSSANYVLCNSRLNLGPVLPTLRHYVHKAKALYAATEWRLWLEHSTTQPSGLF